jgi:RNA-binding protein
LRGLGHRLKPIILVGKEGVSPGLIARVREELVIHELIKVKVLQNSPMDKEEAGPLLVDGSGATLVATIGKTFLLYAPHPLEPVIRLPRVRDQRGE